MPSRSRSRSCSRRRGQHRRRPAGAPAEDDPAADVKGVHLLGATAYAADLAAGAAYARAAAAAIVVGLGMSPPASSLAPSVPAASDVIAALQMGAGAGASTFPAPPLQPQSADRPDSALAAALTSARAAAAEGQARVRAAALAWEREREATDALARQIAEAEQLLVPPTSLDVGATSSGLAGHRASAAAVIWHDPADPLVAQLHYQVGGV